MAHLLDNARRLLSHREMIPAYLNWCAARSLGGTPGLSVPGGGRVGEFQDFSEYWGNHALVPTGGELRLLQATIRPGGVVLDIGANLGMFAVTMAHLCESATIHSFEPARSTLERLMRNLSRNGVANVEAHHCALSNDTGTIRMAVNQKASAVSRISQGDEPEGAEWAFEEVPCTTIDAFCSAQGIDTLDFVKIDVEGAEPQVLAGASAMLARRAIRCLYLEICPANLAEMNATPDDLARVVHSFGYRFFAVEDDGTTDRELHVDDLEAMDLENVVARPV